MIEIDHYRQHNLDFYVCKTPYYRLTLCSLGAMIYRLETQDKNGHFKNIVYTYEQFEHYHNNVKYAGITVGPYAGRISPLKVTVNNRNHVLNANEDDVYLHSGSHHLGTQVFTAKTQDNAIKFIIKKPLYDLPSPDYITVTYRLKQKGFSIDYHTNTKAATFISLTNHSYFNLSGDFSQDIGAHKLLIEADSMVQLNAKNLPKTVEKIHNTPFDFTELKPLKILFDSKLSLDNPFIFNQQGKVKLVDDQSKRTMTITTNYPAVVVYTNNEPSNTTHEDGSKDNKHHSICLECQYIPNDIFFLKQAQSYYPPMSARTMTINYAFEGGLL